MKKKLGSSGSQTKLKSKRRFHTISSKRGRSGSASGGKSQEVAEFLRMAILSGDQAGVRKICEEDGFSVKILEKTDQNGRTPFLTACFVYNVGIALYLLDIGADVTAVDHEDMNGLHHLCKHRQSCDEEELLTLKTCLHGMIGKHCDVDKQDSNAEASPLHHAAALHSLETVNILLQHGASVNITNRLMEIPLLCCLKSVARGLESNPESLSKEWSKVAIRLIAKGSDPKQCDVEGVDCIAVLKEVKRSPSCSIEMSAQVLSLLDACEKIRPEDIELAQASVREKSSDFSLQLRAHQDRARKVVSVGAEASRNVSSRQREANELDLDLISDAVTANIRVGYGSPEFDASDLQLSGIYRQYQNHFYGNSHCLFVCNSAQSKKIVAVLMNLDEVRNMFRALIVNRFGLWEEWIPIQEGSTTPRTPRSENILEWVSQHWSGQSIDFQLLDSRTEQSNLALLVQANKDDGGDQDCQWSEVNPSKSDLPLHILGLECRLGLPMRISIGLVCVLPGQSEEEAFENTLHPPAFDELLHLLAHRVKMASWNSYKGGLSSIDTDTAWYTSWRGFEVILHVSTLLKPDLQRRHIGNDKCVVYCCCDGASFQPAFRGNVNAVGLVVQHQSAEQALEYDEKHREVWQEGALDQQLQQEAQGGWRLGCFWRGRITNFQPVLTTSVISNTDIRDAILLNAINGIAAASKSPPYSTTIDKLFHEETDRLVNAFSPSLTSPREKLHRSSRRKKQGK